MLTDLKTPLMHKDELPLGSSLINKDSPIATMTASSSSASSSSSSSATTSSDSSVSIVVVKDGDEKPSGNITKGFTEDSERKGSVSMQRLDGPKTSTSSGQTVFFKQPPEPTESKSTCGTKCSTLQTRALVGFGTGAVASVYFSASAYFSLSVGGGVFLLPYLFDLTKGVYNYCTTPAEPSNTAPTLRP